MVTKELDCGPITSELLGCIVPKNVLITLCVGEQLFQRVYKLTTHVLA